MRQSVLFIELKRAMLSELTAVLENDAFGMTHSPEVMATRLAETAYVITRPAVVRLRQTLISERLSTFGASAAFELAAYFFEQDTGMLPIGKDDPSRLFDEAERGRVWLVWRKEHAV